MTSSPFVEPAFSKGRVDRAGARIGTPDEQPDDVTVLENWRASHANILNTFKTILYNRSHNFDVKIVQRLKRKPTIIDKLQRELGMRLSRMHDIAGCRVIFQELDDLYAFRQSMHNGRFEHVRRGVEDDRWNYIERPKDSGYRGIHDVFTYQVEPKKGTSRESQPWNGLLVEIQYRTHIQNVWATAVELAGLVTENDPKFDRGSDEFKDFFKVASELLARAYEDRNSCYPKETDEDLADRLYELEGRTHILQIFSELKKSREDLDLKSSSILIFRYDADLFDSQLEVRTFASVNAAILEYNRLESELAKVADIVLVGSRSEESIRAAYKNYFSDAEDFINLIHESIEILLG